VCVSVSVCVCLWVTRQYCIKTAKRRITQTTLRDSPGTLVFWRQKSFVDDLPSPWNLRSKWPTHPPFKQHNFHQYLLIAPQPWQLAKKVQIALGNRKSTTRFPKSHRWTVYVIPNSPKGWHKTRFCYFSVNSKFCRKKSATKFICVKTSSGKAVAISFLYLTVHRWIAGDVPGPHLPNICAQSDPPRWKTPISTDFA